MTPTEYEALRIAWNDRREALNALKRRNAASTAARERIAADASRDAGRLTAGARRRSGLVDMSEAETELARVNAEIKWISIVWNVVGDVEVDYDDKGCNVDGTKFSYVRED